MSSHSPDMSIDTLLRSPAAEVSLLMVRKGFAEDAATILAAYPFADKLSGAFALYREYGLSSPEHASILLPRLASVCLKNGEAGVGANATCSPRDLMVEIATAYPEVALATNTNEIRLPPEVLRAAFRSSTATKRAKHPAKPQEPAPLPAEPAAQATEEWKSTVPSSLAADEVLAKNEAVAPPITAPFDEVADEWSPTVSGKLAEDATIAPPEDTAGEEVVVALHAPAMPGLPAVSESLPVEAAPRAPEVTDPVATQAQPAATKPEAQAKSANVLAVLDMLEAVRSGRGQHMNIPDTRALPAKAFKREGTINPTTENGHARAS